MSRAFKTPKVSAIITTYNRPDFLRKAIKSVLAQTYHDFELLILDNSSAIDTEKTVKEFNDARIRYIKHQPLGIAQARNLGVREAKGKFIAFLDDDDKWLLDKLESQLKIFEKAKDDIALVYGGCLWVDANGEPIKIHFPILRGFVIKDLLWTKDAFTGSASNPMLLKSAIEELGGYNERIRAGEDWELYLRLTNKYKVDFTPEIILTITEHSGVRLGMRLLDAADLEIYLLEEWKGIFNENKKLQSFYLQKIGGKMCRMGQAREGRTYLRKAIMVSTFNGLAYMQFLFSFLGTHAYRALHEIYSTNRKNA